ncbi:MAG TPA: glycosyltransferase family 39 protein [Anaerolineae bacterium]|nr:glycosyltransferase family 39 protein [Anaerolineae bacterium]
MSKSIPSALGTPTTLSLPHWRAVWENARVREGLILVVCVCAALVATLPHSPANMSYVWPDSGVFQYIAHRLLEGQKLYREVWDHKPPLIYYINVLGVWLGGESRWGVWALSFLAMTTAVWLSVRLLRRAFGTALALVVTALWLLVYFNLVEDGNMTEEYVLPLQFACLLLAVDVETQRGGVYRWRGAVIGVMLGLIFFLKSNEIGVGIAIAGYILAQGFFQRQWRPALANLATILGGFALVCAAMFAFLSTQGILADYLDVAVRFNLYYSARFPFLTGTLDALQAGFSYLSLAGLAAFGILGFALGLICFTIARERMPASLILLLGICALALPIEFALVTMTRRTFDHYYVALLYVLAVWAAFLLWLVREAVITFAASHNPRVAPITTTGIVLGVVVLMLPAFRADYNFALALHRLEPPAVVSYIREHTNPTDTVLTYGLEPRMLLFAERRAPTRFADTVPFEILGYVTPEMVEGYYNEILAKRPALVADSMGYGLRNFTPVDSKKIRRLLNRLRKHYQSVGKMQGWTVYERVH